MAPGLSSAVRAPCRAPGQQEELEPGCSTTPRPGDAATWGRERWAGNVYWTGLGGREARGRPFPDFCPRGGPRRGRKLRWVWSAREGEKLRCDQFQQAPPERPARHGHPVALLPRSSPGRSFPSSPSSGGLGPPPAGYHSILPELPLSPWQGLLGTCWPQRPALSPVLPAAPQPLARGRQAGCRELAAPSRKLQSICNALSLIESSELNFNKAFVSSRLIVKASLRPAG